jgi:hypothetical protein
MMRAQPAGPAFREGDEIVLAHGTYQGTLGVLLRLTEDVNARTSRRAMATSAATL